MSEHEWEASERRDPEKTYVKPTQDGFVKPRANWLLVGAAWLCLAAMPVAAVTPALLIFGTDFALADAAEQREYEAKAARERAVRDARNSGPFNTRSYDLHNSAFLRSLFGYSNGPDVSTSDPNSANFGNPFGQQNDSSYTGRGDEHERYGGPR